MFDVQVLNLNLPEDGVTSLMAESALNWVLENTTLKFDITNTEEMEALPASVKLFVLKYLEVMSVRSGVSSESIEGLSQSFNSSDKAGLLFELAETLLGKWLVSPVSFVPAVSRWEYGR